MRQFVPTIDFFAEMTRYMSHANIYKSAQWISGDARNVFDEIYHAYLLQIFPINA